MKPNIIRTKVICVFKHNNQILVGDCIDPTKNQLFYCPAGGGVEFGETTADAIKREIKEELNAEITDIELLGVLENLFTFDGQQGHEIVFVYDAKFMDQSFYSNKNLKGTESNGMRFNAIWINLDDINENTPPIYPDGLIDLLLRELPVA
jgi:ADP-ribose pyrophosphatase YjhB (NUDIX family)